MAISKINFKSSPSATPETWMDLTGDTVTAATLMSPQTAHGANGELVTGTATPKTLTTKTITANGTYNASSDNADGYSSIVVNVPSSTTSRLILGGKNEVVTYAGPASGTVTLNASGAGTINLSNGSYQFNGGTSGYVRTVTIDSNTTTIHVRPVGTIYWYGAWAVNPLYSYSKDPGVVDNDTYCTWNSPQNNTWHVLYSPDDGDGYSSCTLKYRGSYSTSYTRLGYGSSNSPNTSGETLASNFVSQDATNWASITFSFTAATGKAPRIYSYKYNNRSYYLDIQEWYLGSR